MDSVWHDNHGVHDMKDGIGARALRKEDRRFLTGRGNYVADIERPDMVAGLFLRSPHAHAVLRSIDVVPALSMPVPTDSAYVPLPPWAHLRSAWMGTGGARLLQ